MKRHNLGAFTLLEVLVAGAIVVALAFPIMTTLSTAGHEAASSEDLIVAEAMAERVLQEALAIPWEELDKQLPLTRDVKGLDRSDQPLIDGHPELKQSYEGPEAPQGRLEIRRLEPGLMRYMVSLSWPVRPGSSTRRHYTLLRYRARSDASVRISWPIPQVPGVGAIPGGTR